MHNLRFEISNLKLPTVGRTARSRQKINPTYSTIVENSLQIGPFLQNKANFRKSQMNITSLLTSKYCQMDILWNGKNKAKTNPIQTQTKPIQSQTKPFQDPSAKKTTMSLTTIMRNKPKANFVSKLALLLVCLIGAIAGKAFADERDKYLNAAHLSADTGNSGTNSTGKAMIRLDKWKNGITIQSLADQQAFIYLRFYEWNLFDAVSPGEHTPGKDEWPWLVSSDGKTAVMKSEPMQITAEVQNDGVVLNLTITNVSDHDWPEIAAIIPCLSPDYAREGVPVNPRFYDHEHERTYFIGRNGLELLKDREIHFRDSFRDRIIHRSGDRKGTFETFSQKWPTSDKDAVSGLMVRESVDGKWVAGIAWADFLSAQGHNPRKCAHLSVRVGPLKCGQSKKVRGKIYLFQGTKEDCLMHYHRDFLHRTPCGGASSKEKDKK